MDQNSRRVALIATVMALVAASCGNSSTTTTAATNSTLTAGTQPAAASSASTSGKRACIILPDAEDGSRWESQDRPALDAGLTEVGVDVDIQNAQSDPTKYVAIGDQQLSKGCGVMILVDDNQGSGATVAARAREQSIPVIAYDRPITGADYFVSFDNTKVGALQGQTIIDGLKAAGKDPALASVVYASGDPGDGNAKSLLDGATAVLDASGVKAAYVMTGTWDDHEAGAQFQQALTELDGKVDAVLAPNDNIAAAIITILDKANVTAVISGQDASVAGLQNVLLAKQTATVYKPFRVEAKSASDLAVQLLNGSNPVAPSKLDDGTPFFPNDPILVSPDEVEDVVTAGDAKASDICIAAVAAACTKYGVR